MGEREWMHESTGPESSSDRFARRFASTDLLSGRKFVWLVVVIVVIGVGGLVAAAALS